jgi:hypothetical protein
MPTVLPKARLRHGTCTTTSLSTVLVMMARPLGTRISPPPFSA